MADRLPAAIAEAVVGRRRELSLLLAAVRLKKPTLLVGPPGVSKTTMLRALADYLGEGRDEEERFIWVTGDEQLTAQALVGTFDPSLVLKGGYRAEYFHPGPLALAMQAGGILYVEEINRAPSGALNAMLTALSEGYLQVPHLGRIAAETGFTVVGGANPLDDVGTTRLSRGLLDRFIVIELDYQPRDEEIEIVRRHTRDRLPRFRLLAVDLARRTREHPDLRHGASVRAAIDLVNLVAEELTDGAVDRSDLEWLACAAFAGKLRVRPTARKSACQIVLELLDAVLAEYVPEDDFGSLLLPGHAGEPVDAEGSPSGTVAEEGEAALAEGGQRDHTEPRDELPGLARPGGGGEPGESRSVPMTGRDRPVTGGDSLKSLERGAADPLADFEEVIRRALGLVLRIRGSPLPEAASDGGSALHSRRWREGRQGELDVLRTLERYAERAGSLRGHDIRLFTRTPEVRNYLILVDHSGSMVGRKLTLAAVVAGVLAELSVAGRANYGVLAFDEELTLVKDLAVEEDVAAVIERILHLPEGRATDLSRALRGAAEMADHRTEATDVILISDCMPTKGRTSFGALDELVRAIPSLHICYMDEQTPAIQIFHEDSRFDLYEWWARRWVGDERVYRMRDVSDARLLIEGLSTQSDQGL